MNMKMLIFTSVLNLASCTIEPHYNKALPDTDIGIKEVSVNMVITSNVKL